MNLLRAHPDLAFCALIICAALLGRFLSLIGV